MSEPAFTDYDEFFDKMEENKMSGDGFENRPKDKKIIILKIIVFVLAAFLIFEGILYSIIIPSLATPVVSFSGNSIVSEEELSQALFPLHNKSWAGYDTNLAVDLLSSVSSLESSSVVKHFPDKIEVTVVERKPVAKTILNVNGISKSVQIDENGVLFNVQSSFIAQDNSVPLVTGLPVDTLHEGLRLPSKYLGLMDQIAVIRKLPQKYFAAISEIQVVQKEYGNFELVLYPAHTRVKVLTDRSLNEDALKYMMVVLDVVNSIEPDVTEIDLRYSSVSYRRRQAL